MLEWPYLVATPCVTKVGSGIPGDQISSAVRLTQVVDVRWPRFVGQLGGLIKVYTSCRSCRQNPFASISLPLLLRLWGCGQGA